MFVLFLMVCSLCRFSVSVSDSLWLYVASCGPSYLCVSLSRSLSGCCFFTRRCVSLFESLCAFVYIRLSMLFPVVCCIFMIMAASFCVVCTSMYALYLYVLFCLGSVIQVYLCLCLYPCVVIVPPRCFSLSVAACFSLPCIVYLCIPLFVLSVSVLRCFSVDLAFCLVMSLADSNSLSLSLFLYLSV